MIEKSSPLNILLVNNNENERLLFRNTFQKSNISCEITECARAEEALERLGAGISAFDVVAVDHNLPGISGTDLCKKLLDEQVPLPLVLLAEMGSEQLVAEALTAGVHDYIIKDPQQGYLVLLPISLINVVSRYDKYCYYKQTGNIMQDNKQPASAFLESIPDTAGLIDTDGNVLMINKAGAESLGRSVDEIIGKNAREFIYEDVYELRRAKWTQVIQTGKISYLEDERDGKYFETWFSPVFDAKGKVVSVAVFAHDITNHKKTGNALKQSEEKFRLAMEVTNDALWDWNMTTNEVYRNPRHATMLGYESHELTASQEEWENRIHPDDRQAVLQILNEHIAGKRDSIEIEYRLRTKSDDYVWVLGRGKIVAYNEDGSPARMIGTNINITERKRAEEVKTEYETLIRGIVDNSGSIVVVRNLQGQYLMVNTEVEKVLGMESEQIIGKTPFDIHTRDKANNILIDDKKVIDSRCLLEIEDQLNVKGEIRTFQGTRFPLINADGEVYAVCTVATDITKRRQDEEEIRKFKTIADKAGHGVAISDLEGNLIYVNESFAQMHQYRPGELIGTNISIFHTEEQIERVNQLNDQLKQKGGYIAEEVWHKKRDNTVFPTLMSATLVRDEDGEPLFMAATAVDITKHKKAEELLRYSEERYRSVVEDSPVLLCSFLAGGEIIFVNTAYCDYFGRSVEQLIGSNFKYLIPEEDRKAVLDNIMSLTVDSPIITHEHKVYAPDGRIRWQRWTNRALFDEHGRAVSFQAFGEDITDRKNMEDALKESELRYHTLFEILPVGVGLSTLDGRIIDVNSTFQQMLGYSIEEIGRISVQDTYYNPAERPPFLKRLQQDGSIRGFEVQLKRKDGTIFLADLNVTIMKMRGESVIVTVVRDITEHRRMERALAESEEKYRTLVECAGDPIFTVDEKGVFLFANKRAEDDFTDRPDGLVGKTLWDIFPKEMADRKAANVRKAIETGQRLNTVSLSEIQRRPRWYNVTIEPLRDNRGNVTSAMVIARNIDDMKRAEEQIQKLSSAVEQSIDGVAISDVEARLLYVNDSYARMHGYAPEEMRGMKVADLYTNNKSDEYVRTINQRNTQGSFAGEVENVRKDGTIFPVYLSTTLLKNDKEETVGSIAICRDMTQYKQTLEMLKIKDVVIASSISGIAIGDAEGILTYVNHAFLEMWGYENENEVLGRNAVEFWIMQNEVEELLRTMQDRKGWIGELAARKKDGSAMIVQVCATLVNDENGRPISMMGSFVDITESKRREDELSKYRGQMARAEQLASLGTLSATVAHQLTQPLTVIRLSMDNALDELEATSSSETVIRRLRDSVTQVSNITSIIENFRNFARKSSGRTVSEVNLNVVAARIARLLSESARSANIVLRLRNMGDLPCPWMNETDLEQLFFALIENAIQATDGKKTRQLVISGAVKDGNIELRLSDDCGGIAPENLDKIFEPFFTTRPRGQGTGLGLCIVQDVVSRIGGHVRVESIFGKGTTFIIDIPIEKDKIS